MAIKIFCFSGSGNSLSVAKFLSEKLDAEIVEISYDEIPYEAKVSIVIFPVYCQNIPSVVINFLRRLKGKYAVLIATYGKISHGNVLYEASQMLGPDLIGAAYIPMKHTYSDLNLNNKHLFETEPLQKIIERINFPQKIFLPKCKKNIFADFFPTWRSRVALKIISNSNCNSCGLCENKCSFNAIKKGITNKKCIRCLRCVKLCPNNALYIKKSLILKMYLHNEKDKSAELYL